MDPFLQVYGDAETQLGAVEKLVKQYQQNPSSNSLVDVNNSVQELIETIHDLSQSLGAVQTRPSQYGLSEQEIKDRIRKVGNLNHQLGDIQQVISEVKSKSHAVFESSGAGAGADAADTNPSAYQGLMYQDQIQEQDTMLDSVYTTVNNLREQADTMSRELEDQSYLINDLDRQVDTAGDKLRRGIKKIDWVVRNNRETLSSCCITLLIVVLIVLLVLLLVL